MTNESGLEFDRQTDAEDAPARIYTPHRGGAEFIRADLEIPEGYALVPIEPTEEMVSATYGNGKCGSSWCSCKIEQIYKTMLSAAQKGGSQ